MSGAARKPSKNRGKHNGSQRRDGEKQLRRYVEFIVSVLGLGTMSSTWILTTNPVSMTSESDQVVALNMELNIILNVLKLH